MSTFSANGSPTWTAGRLVGPPSSKVSEASTETPPMPSPPVLAPKRITLLPAPRRLGEVDVLDPHGADAEGVDERVALVAVVEDDLAADVGQAEAVAVAADAGDDARQDALRVGVVQVAEAERVHDGDRPGAHRHDVADDPADAGRGALVGLDVGRVVVRLDLEGHRPAVADVDDAGVLADADEELLAHLVGGVLAPEREVDLARLVGAVLAPHDGVHRQLGDVGRRPMISRMLAYSSSLRPSSVQGWSTSGVGGGVLDGVEEGRGPGVSLMRVAALSRAA